MSKEGDGYERKDFESDGFYKAEFAGGKGGGKEVELDVAGGMSMSISFPRSILVLNFGSRISFSRQIYLFFVWKGASSGFNFMRILAAYQRIEDS